MKAIRLSEFGLPQEVLKLEELPVPEPAADEVLIRLQARPINPSDIFQIMGLYGIKPKLPATAGVEAAGTIERIGADVTTLKPGQKVIPLKTGGTWQEYTAVKSTQVVAVPDAMSVETASMLIANPMSAYLMTRVVMKVEPGAWLVQSAAGSALGQMVIQLSKVYGFKTINIVRRREQFDELQALGADEMICSADEDIETRIKEITGGKGAPFAIDAVAGEVGTKMAAGLGPDGIMLIYGAMDRTGVTVNPGAMIFKEATVKGFWLTRWLSLAPPEQKQELFAAVVPLVMAGKITSPVAARYQLEDFREAVIHAQQAARGGKILLVND
ncbi:MAG: zinc-dependent alcohol dehydrogenase family protein [Blastocatellia bacterium]|nr:zinc-dependent alcohol dehydrogenase family protein [Blastocatellia bacterium]